MTTRVTVHDPLTYIYRSREGSELHILRRPSWMGDAADNNIDWLARIVNKRKELFLINSGPPAYENLTAYGRPVHTMTSRNAGRTVEIANVLARLSAGTDDQRVGRECYVIS